MKGDQQSMSFVFGLFAVATATIMLILNVRSDIKHIKSGALGGYVSTPIPEVVQVYKRRNHE
jgi:hypothetical protein